MNKQDTGLYKEYDFIFIRHLVKQAEMNGNILDIPDDIILLT